MPIRHTFAPMKLPEIIVGITAGTLLAASAVAQPPPPPTNPPKINELMAANTTVYADEFGEYDDWVELYNPLGAPFQLGGLYVSDDPAQLTKYQLPNNIPSIPAMGFLVLWADDSTEQGPTHLPFKLTSAGEHFILTWSDGTTVLDQVQFPALGTDVSYGRVSDGNANWQTFSTPTPNATNLPQAIEEVGRGVRAYPNPTTGVLKFNVATTFELFGSDGRTVEQGNDILHLDLNHLPEGVYGLRAANGVVQRIVLLK